MKVFIDFDIFYHSRSALQDVSWPWWGADRKAQAKENQDHLHLGAVEGVGEGLPGDSLPRHLHQGRDRHEDWPHRSQSPSSYFRNITQFSDNLKSGSLAWNWELCGTLLLHIEIWGFYSNFTILKFRNIGVFKANQTWKTRDSCDPGSRNFFNNCGSFLQRSV